MAALASRARAAVLVEAGVVEFLSAAAGGCPEDADLQAAVCSAVGACARAADTRPLRLQQADGHRLAPALLACLGKESPQRLHDTRIRYTTLHEDAVTGLHWLVRSCGG